MTTLNVATCVLIRGGRILLTQRMPPRDFLFCWECPGGKVQSGERQYDAAARELDEEVGLRVADNDINGGIDRLFTQRVDLADHRTIYLDFYLFRRVQGTLRPCESQGIGWFTVDEMFKLVRTPGNRAAAVKLADIMRWKPDATELLLEELPIPFVVGKAP